MELFQGNLYNQQIKVIAEVSIHEPLGYEPSTLPLYWRICRIQITMLKFLDCI